MILYTGDLHFGHKNIILHDKRPFSDVEEMDLTLIQLWNARVASDDHVYINGDFAFRNAQPEEWYLRQLKGHKHLIIGNHDGHLLQNQAAMSYLESVDTICQIRDQNSQICICHYPLAEWGGFHKGYYHIYGHIHSRLDEAGKFMLTRERALNSGCMINHYMPVSLRELIENNRVFREGALAEG